MGLLERIYATRVAMKVLDANRLDIDNLSPTQQQTLMMIAVSLRDKGFSKSDAQGAIQQLVGKHGGVASMLDFYAENFGV